MSLAALIFLTATQTPKMQRIEIKPAGVALFVPKSWKGIKKSDNALHSFAIPTTDKKSVARLDIGYLVVDGSDAVAFENAQKEMVGRLGQKLVTSTMIDILGGKMPVVEYTEGGVSFIRAVLFNQTAAKLRLILSAPASEIDSVRPSLTSIYETFKSIKVESAKGPVVAEEKRIVIQPRAVDKVVAPVTFAATNQGRLIDLGFKRGTKLQKIDESTVKAVFGSGLSLTASVFATDQKGYESVAIGKMKDSLERFAGAVDRIDETDLRYRELDLGRRFVWREGKLKDGTSLMIGDVFIVAPGFEFVHLQIETTQLTKRASLRSAVKNFARAMTLKVK